MVVLPLAPVQPDGTVTLTLRTAVLPVTLPKFTEPSSKFTVDLMYWVNSTNVLSNWLLVTNSSSALPSAPFTFANVEPSDVVNFKAVFPES